MASFENNFRSRLTDYVDWDGLQCSLRSTVLFSCRNWCPATSCHSLGQNAGLARAASVVSVPSILFIYYPKSTLKQSWVRPEVVGRRNGCAIWLLWKTWQGWADGWEGHVSKNHKANPENNVASLVQLFPSASTVGGNKIWTLFQTMGWKTSSKALSF